MTVSTWFEGDPESCRRVARRLDRLAESLEDSGRLLHAQATLAPEDFEGLSGDTYRRSAARLRDDSVGTAAAQRALAVALDGFATELDDVRRVLRRARALAVDDLVVSGTDIEPPGPGATERQREVFRMVEGAVAEARRVEDQAHHDWQAALAQHAGTAAPSPLTTAPSGLPVPHPLPDPLPERPADPPDDPRDDAAAGGSSSSPPTADTAPAAATRPPGPVAGAGEDLQRPAGDRLVEPPTDDWAPVPAASPGASPAGPELIEWELSDGPR